MASSIKERLISLINKNLDCWEWSGSISNQGYGRLTVGSRTDKTRRTRSAHRVSYETFVGKIPKGLVIDHLCKNRKCINPSHLEPVTIQENIKRGDSGKFESSKTHCPKGHEYSEDNIYKYGNSRNCKICMKTRSIKNYWELKGVGYA